MQTVDPYIYSLDENVQITQKYTVFDTNYFGIQTIIIVQNTIIFIKALEKEDYHQKCFISNA